MVSSQNGIGGISSGIGFIVRHCTANANATIGFAGGSSTAYMQCCALGNQTGFSLSSNTTVTECLASQNSFVGFTFGAGVTISRCAANQNGTGFKLALGCTITDSTANLNNVGIDAGSGCSIVRCAVRISATNGIVVANQCVVESNNCAFNGDNGDGAGILVTGVDNRIEGNQCTFADRGIDVNGAGNIIIRNTCSGNITNWDIVASNAVAPIIVASTNGAAITGNSYAGSLGSTDPNANYTF